MKKKLVLIFFSLSLIIVLVACGGSDSKQGDSTQKQGDSTQKIAKPVTIKAVTAWAENDQFNVGFWLFKQKVDEIGKGIVDLQWVGGPEAVPPFELMEATRNGVVDMSYLVNAYASAQVPDALAGKLSKETAVEERKSGFYELMNKAFQEQGNAFYLGRAMDGATYNTYLNKPINKVDDIKGLTFRVTPVFKAFYAALGAELVTTTVGEIYTSIERNIIDGFGYPSYGLTDYSLEEVTKYVLEPPFYTIPVAILINLDKWNDLPSEAKEVLQKAIIETEAEVFDLYQEIISKERKLIQEKGMKVIELPEEEAKKYIDIAHKAAWEELVQRGTLVEELRKYVGY